MNRERPRNDRQRARQRAPFRAVPTRSGHRWEVDPRRERVGLRTRQARTLEDLGIYRCAALKDIIAERFDGHPYAARRALDALRRQGLVGEFEARGPRGKAFRVLHLTARGRQRVEQARHSGLAPGQRYWGGRVKAREASHEAAVYRAGREESRKIEEAGGRVVRIRCDSELKSEVARATEKARARHGGAEADRIKQATAEELGVPVVDGKVLYPDLQIEYIDADGREGRVSVEVATGHYRGKEVAAKAAAGFQMHAADGRARHKLGLADLEGSGRGGGDRRERGLLDL